MTTPEDRLRNLESTFQRLATKSDTLALRQAISDLNLSLRDEIARAGTTMARRDLSTTRFFGAIAVVGATSIMTFLGFIASTNLFTLTVHNVIILAWRLQKLSDRIAPVLPVQRGNVKLSNLQVLNAILYVAEQGASGGGCRPERQPAYRLHTDEPLVEEWSARPGV